MSICTEISKILVEAWFDENIESCDYPTMIGGKNAANSVELCSFTCRVCTIHTRRRYRRMKQFTQAVYALMLFESLIKRGRSWLVPGWDFCILLIQAVGLLYSQISKGREKNVSKFPCSVKSLVAERLIFILASIVLWLVILAWKIGLNVNRTFWDRETDHEFPSSIAIEIQIWNVPFCRIAIPQVRYVRWKTSTANLECIPFFSFFFSLLVKI